MTTLGSNEFLDLGQKRFKEVCEEELSHHGSNGKKPYPFPRGTWEAAACIPTIKQQYRADEKFLKLVKHSLSQASYDKIWSFEDAKKCRYESPRVYSSTWENFAVNNYTDTELRYQYFNIFDPKGKFYHGRSSDDDLILDRKLNNRGECFDVHLPFVQCVQAIKTILKLAEIFEVGEKDYIEFSFRWIGLRNRTTASWLCEESFFPVTKKAYQDDITVTFQVARVVKLSDVFTPVRRELMPVYNLFEGFSLDEERADTAINRYFRE